MIRSIFCALSSETKGLKHGPLRPPPTDKPSCPGWAKERGSRQADAHLMDWESTGVLNNMKIGERKELVPTNPPLIQTLPLVHCPLTT